MRKIAYKLINLIYYIRFFGKGTGFYVWSKINFSTKKEVTINTSFFSNPVQIRLNDSDPEIFNQIFGELQYKWPQSELLHPTVIFDAGANIGLSALYFAHQFPQASIYCIEPDPTNFSYLKKNIKNYSRITAINGALWHKDELLDLHKSEYGSAASSVQTGDSNSKIEGITISTIQKRYQLPKIDILKIDIEGSEIELFQSEQLEWLNEVSIIIIELHDDYRKGSSSIFLKKISNRIEKLYISGENLICYLKKQVSD